MRHVIRTFLFVFAVLLVAGSVVLSPANATGMIECSDEMAVTAEHMDHDHSDAHMQASHEDETQHRHADKHCGSHACIYGVDLHDFVAVILTRESDVQVASSDQSLVREAYPDGLRRPPRV